MKNLAELILDRGSRFPNHKFSMADSEVTLGSLIETASGVVGLLEKIGINSDDRVAVIGANSDSYLAIWFALQLGGIEAALINPAYPEELLAEMLSNLEPKAIIWVGIEPSKTLIRDVLEIDGSDAINGSLIFESKKLSNGMIPKILAGLSRQPGEIAGFMHTSGTTGTPKFCAQTHEYFLRLGRFIADTMTFSESDTIFAPLPLFHINPLGYGVIGALTGNSQFVSVNKFSASGFWPLVKEAEVTALILHAPPVEILKRATTRADSINHRVRIVFYTDREFLDEFQIPLGVSAYGSTESGGLSHVWLWRQGDQTIIPEGLSRYGGRCRHELAWRINPDGEIELRPNRENVMFSGYQRGNTLVNPFREDGWFETGDLGRVDEQGNLVFIERRSESIRVKGEFVPISYVEDIFSKVESIKDIAIWRRPSELVDDEIVLFVETFENRIIDMERVEETRQALPAFMRPLTMIIVDQIPRDAGVGKIRRRELFDCKIISEVQL